MTIYSRFKNFEKILLTLACVALFPLQLQAATGDIINSNVPLRPIISGPDDVAIRRTLVLEASASLGIGEDTTYRWYRDNISFPISKTVEAVYTPEKAGTTTIKLVISTTIDGEVVESETEKTITVYERKIVLIADETVSIDKLNIHQKAAEEKGIFLPVLKPSSAASVPLASEEPLIKFIKEQSSILNGAEAIVLWTDGITGLQAFMRAIEGDAELMQSIKTQTIILISNRSIQTLGRIANGPFAVLRPDSILITRKNALNPLFDTANIQEFVSELEQRDNDYLIVNASNAGIRPWNLLSSLVNYMLTHGVSSQTVILLLMLPVIAMILAFLKQVV